MLVAPDSRLEAPGRDKCQNGSGHQYCRDYMRQRHHAVLLKLCFRGRIDLCVTATDSRAVQVEAVVEVAVTARHNAILLLDFLPSSGGKNVAKTHATRSY